MKVVCAWCNRLIKEVPDNGMKNVASHGICPQCRWKQLAILGKAGSLYDQIVLRKEEKACS